MTNDPPDQRRPRTGWRPPPGGYRDAEQPQPEPPPPPPPPRPGARWQQPGPYQPPPYQPPPPYPYQQQPPPQYQQQPAYRPPYGQQYPPPPKAPPGRVLSIIAFVLAGIALLLFPPLFALAGVILSVIAITKGDPLGKWALAASIAGGVLGMVIAIIAANAID